MQGPLIQAPIGLETTAVDPPRIRRVHLRAVRSRPIREDETSEDGGHESALGRRGNPGDTLARARLPQLLMREAIVRRNHHIERPPVAPDPTIPAVTIDWVRSQDLGLRIRLLRADSFRIRGIGAGRPTRSSPPRTPAIAIAMDGLIYTERVYAGDEPAAIIARLAARLRERLCFVISETSVDDITVRLTDDLT